MYKKTTWWRTTVLSIYEHLGVWADRNRIKTIALGQPKKAKAELQRKSNKSTVDGCRCLLYLQHSYSVGYGPNSRPSPSVMWRSGLSYNNTAGVLAKCLWIASEVKGKIATETWLYNSISCYVLFRLCVHEVCSVCVWFRRIRSQSE